MPGKISLQRFIDEKRSVSYTILLTVWGIVAVYAMLHDQYVVRIAPQHFTEYHKPIPGITGAKQLALVHAFGASIAPGLLLGLACVFAGRSGSLPKVSVREILTGVLWVIVFTEVIAISCGFYAYQTRRTIFPDFLYPEFSRPMIASQSTQLACYLASGCSSVVLLAVLLGYRLRKRNVSASMPPGCG